MIQELGMSITIIKCAFLLLIHDTAVLYTLQLVVDLLEQCCSIIQFLNQMTMILQIGLLEMRVVGSAVINSVTSSLTDDQLIIAQDINHQI